MVADTTQPLSSEDMFRQYKDVYKFVTIYKEDNKEVLITNARLAETPRPSSKIRDRDL